MIRDEYLRRLIDAAYVDVYLSANDGKRIYWPYRMHPVHEANKGYRDACESYIIDSSFQDESITNEDVLDTAFRLDAEMAVLADVYHDADATVQALLEGRELADDHPYDGKLIAPLQPPHDACYDALEGQFDVYAIGGLKDAGGFDQIQAARSVRERAGPDVRIHGLGFGVSDELVWAAHEWPGLLDSIDYSTPVQNSMAPPVDHGEDHMSVIAARAGAMLVEDVRRLTPLIEPPAMRQTTLAFANGEELGGDD